VKLKIGDLVWLRPPFQINNDYGVIVSRETRGGDMAYRVRWTCNGEDHTGLYFANDVVLAPSEAFYVEDFEERIKDRIG